MIILFHPRATKPRNCRLPLAVLALAAVLEGREEYRIIDGNLEEDPTAAILSTINVHQVELLGVSWGAELAAAPARIDALGLAPAPFAAATILAEVLGRRLLAFWLADLIITRQLRWPAPFQSVLYSRSCFLLWR